ncbi:hypothetical protein [Roseovarius sp. A-2]|uniref:hypothetical protein n=1 Tax=Roseovarius sp. A-2 TaxID=1570360 RepID=UPI001117EEBA|nr:hypothetical protein [Roseovarius sp. A-2]
MTEEYLDAEFAEDREDREIAELARRPGATFRSVFGGAIYNNARNVLSDLARERGLNSREKEAVWPGVLIGQIGSRAAQAREMGLEGAPDPERVEKETQKAAQFRQAYEAVSGVSLDHPARNIGGMSDRAQEEIRQNFGSPKLSAHERLARAHAVPSVLREQAKELHDTGVSEYTESAIRIGEHLSTGERDREDRRRKPVRVKSRGGPVL